MTNRERAEAARDALSVFTNDTYGGRIPEELHPDDVLTAVYDLMGDLGHFLRLYAEENSAAIEEHFDFEYAQSMAKYHYEAERRADWDEEE